MKTSALVMEQPLLFFPRLSLYSGHVIGREFDKKLDNEFDVDFDRL